MLKSAATCVLLLLCVSFAFGESPEKFSRIRVYVPDRAMLDHVWSTGIDYEGASGKVGGWMEFVTGPAERAQLTRAGVQFTIVDDDVSRTMAQGLVAGPVNALGFGYGSMGGYYTYDEVKRQLDSMVMLYPSLITPKDSIGQSIEGRAICAVKISDNPGANEPDEPEALYTALHHAREPEGMMAVIYYMWWLLEHYGTDPDATYLVDNRQMWFIPVVNPDGYVRNQTTNPNGGGMWRKNRRNNGNGSYGVDLNRNYGPTYMWNAPNGGSSTNPGSDTYRGTAPFSEPETQVINAFMWSHDIKTCLNYHTYGNYLIFPWGYLSQESDDSLTYREFTFDMVGENRYNSGTDQQTVSYSTRGNSDDYMYGATLSGTFAMTPEVGTSATGGFWPPTGQILPLAVENLGMNIYYSYVAGQRCVLKHHAFVEANGNGFLERGESFQLLLTIRNKGLGDASSAQATVSSSTPGIHFTTSTASDLTIGARSDLTVTFSGSVSLDAQNNAPFDVSLELTDPNGYLHRDTIRVFIGTPIIVLADSATSGLSNWYAGESWGTTAHAHTPPYSFTDSPSGSYTAAANNSLTLKEPLILAGLDFCILRFWTKWAIEPTWDFATVEVSTNGGTDWITLRSKLSRPGSDRGVQFTDTWGYDGYTPGLDWVEQEVDLTPFVNQMVNLRFRLASDGGDQRDGWYVDDIRIYGYPSSQYQESGILLSAGSGSTKALVLLGEHPAATDGIDTALGEFELPPKPGSDTFDFRWSIPPTNGTGTNVQPMLSPLNVENVFIAEIQAGAVGYPLTLTWDANGFNRGGWHLRDGATHGTRFSINMWTDTAYTITDTAIHSVEIVHTLADTASIPIFARWQMLAVPVETDDRSQQTLFPDATTRAFAYEGRYNAVDTLEYSRGYWLKHSGNGSRQFIGVPIVRDTITIPDGWAMLGGLSYSVPFSQMICNPPPCRAYVFRESYMAITELLPAEGFWIKGPRTISLSCIKGDGLPLEKENGLIDANSYSTLTFTDNDGSRTSLHFGTGDPNDPELSEYELPPIPPMGGFDVRFVSQRSVELFDRRTAASEAAIAVQSTRYPLTITWTLQEAEDEQQYVLIQRTTEGATTRHPLVTNGTITLRHQDVGSLMLRRLASRQTPTEISLYQNVPNPFNPSTTISFDVPKPSSITLTVFNMLGQEVVTLIDNQPYAPGSHRVAFDASELSSGLYFYQLMASPTQGGATVYLTKKMLLLK